MHRDAELGCCQVELPRAQEILRSTSRLLALLEREPSADELRELIESHLDDPAS